MENVTLNVSGNNLNNFHSKRFQLLEIVSHRTESSLTELPVAGFSCIEPVLLWRHCM
jgi:hypothetical protein